MKHCFMVALFSALTVSPALAQQTTTMPLPLNAEGLGQEVALSFTPTDLDGVDRVNYVAYVHNDATRQNSTLGGIREEVTEAVAHRPSSVQQLPPTLTVNTAALLELHSLRQSAVSLCLQLPAKYRTRLPQCAEIFEHEIRLTALSKVKR
jgi:hypothetical protein